MDLGSNNRLCVFDLQTTVGTAAINTQLKANKTNMKASQGERIFSVVIELESSKNVRNISDRVLEGRERWKCPGLWPSLSCLFWVRYVFCSTGLVILVEYIVCLCKRIYVFMTLQCHLWSLWTPEGVKLVQAHRYVLCRLKNSPTVDNAKNLL